MKNSIFIFLMLLTCIPAFPQDDSEVILQLEEGHEQEASDNREKPVFEGESVAIREIDRNAVREITGGIDYTERAVERETSKEESREPTSVSISTPWDGRALKWVGYIAITGLVLWFLFSIIRNADSPANRKVVYERHQSPHTVENIEELEIDRLLREARESGNYRLVIRIQYLALLKALNSNGLIKWERDKTNREYVMELFSKEALYHEFRKLTLAYETVWYGEHEIDVLGSEQITSAFDSIHKQLAARPR